MQPINRLLLTGLCLLGATGPGRSGSEMRPMYDHGSWRAGVMIADTTDPNQSPPEPAPLGGGGSDELTTEIEGILGEAENGIMQGIQDELSSVLNSALGQFLNVSPISAVKSLQKMVKDGLSKQQKIEYQHYKVDYAWKKAHTDLSPAFASYYRDLNLKQLTDAILASKKAADKFLSTAAFTPQEAQAMKQTLSDAANTDDLVSEVKTVVNLGGKAVWMSEGERLSALNAVRTDLYGRIKRMNQLLGIIRATDQYRSRDIAKNAYRQSLYKTGSALNRTVGSRGITYQTR